MDPNETLRRIREQIEKLHHGDLIDPDAAELGRELGDAVKDLDEWLSRDGFLPAAWRGKRCQLEVGHNATGRRPR